MAKSLGTNAAVVMRVNLTYFDGFLYGPTGSGSMLRICRWCFSSSNLDNPQKALSNVVTFIQKPCNNKVKVKESIFRYFRDYRWFLIIFFLSI